MHIRKRKKSFLIGNFPGIREEKAYKKEIKAGSYRYFPRIGCEWKGKHIRKRKKPVLPGIFPGIVEGKAYKEEEKAGSSRYFPGRKGVRRKRKHTRKRKTEERKGEGKETGQKSKQRKFPLVFLGKCDYNVLQNETFRSK